MLYGSVAQSVEQRTENPRVGGSIPSRAIFYCGGLAKWPNAADCKSVLSEFGGSNPSASTSFFICEPLAQLVEHLTFNQGVEGSSPSWLITLKHLTLE